MSLIILAVLSLFLLQGKPRFAYSLAEDGSSLSHNRTNVINAFFIVIVLLRHINQRLVPFYGADVIYRDFFDSMAGQGIVSTFFFFSGYGIMKAIQRKKDVYVRELMSRRFLRLYVNTALCCILAHFVYSFTHLTSFEAIYGVAKTMIGAGSYWFIIMTLLLYVTTWIGFRICGVSRPVRSVMLSALLIYVVCALGLKCKPMWWLDTELCFPCGMLFAIYLNKIENAIRWTRLPIVVIGGLFLILGWALMRYHMYGCYLIQKVILVDVLDEKNKMIIANLYHIFVYPLCTVVWVLGILWIFASIRWKKEPAFLVWLGGPAVFYIFVLHFIPIRVIQACGASGEFSTGVITEAFGWGASYPVLCIVGVLFASLLMAYMGHKFIPRVDSWLFERGKQVKS